LGAEAPADLASAEAARFVAERAAEAKREREAIEHDESRLTALRTASAKVRSERDAAITAERNSKAALDAAERKRDGTAEALRKAEADRDRAATTMANLLASVTPVFAGHTGWEQELAADGIAFGKRCKSRVEE